MKKEPTTLIIIFLAKNKEIIPKPINMTLEIMDFNCKKMQTMQAKTVIKILFEWLKSAEKYVILYLYE